MAESPDIRYSFNEAKAILQALVDETLQEAAEVKAMGDDVRAAQLEARAATYRAQLVTPESVQQALSSLEQYRTAVTQVNEAVAKGTGAEAERVAVIREQTAALEQQAAVRARAMAPAPSYYSREAVLGAAYAPQARYLEQAGTAQVAGAQRVLEVERNLTAVDAARTTQLREQAALAAQQANSYARIMEEALGASAAYDAGAAAAARGGVVTPGQRAQIIGAPAITPAGHAVFTEEQQLRRYNVALGEYQTFAQRADLETAGLSQNLTRLGIAHDQASNALRRHGALTTEFLSALGRGETTIGEFGYQLGATTAKFGGWMVAASATFAVLGGLGEIGKGAIDSSSGVQQLTRTLGDFDRYKAALNLQDLSAGLNVPIKEAADAVFYFSRTFHDLDAAVAAARLGLAAFKLDQVDVQQSVKAQTALHQQFGVGTAGMSDVYDMLAGGQRVYNARMTEMIPLLQASTGAVANASQGDPNALNTLIQLGVYFQRVTQRGGANIGTAFYRSAATFLNPATVKGQKDLAALSEMGIDVSSGDWTKIMLDAIKRAPKLTHEQQLALPGLVFGPQLGGRYASGFGPQAVPTLDRVRTDITPDAQRGRMQEELNHELGRVTERLQMFKNELQRIGAAIGSSGVLSGFNVALSGVTGSLGAVRHAFDLLGGLPGPVRAVSEGLVTLSAALAFFNRTRFGASIADLGFGARDASGLRQYRLSAIPGVGASEQTRQRLQLMTGTRAATEAVNQDLQRVNQQLLQNAARQLELGVQVEAVDRQLLTDGADRTALTERAAQIDATIVDLKLKQAALEVDRNSILETQQGLTAQQQALKRGEYGPGQLAVMGAPPGSAPWVSAARTEQQQQERLGAIKRSLAANEIRQAETEAQRVDVAAAMNVAGANTVALTSRAEALQAQLVGLTEAQTALIVERNEILMAQVAAETEGAVLREGGMLASLGGMAAGAGSRIGGALGGVGEFIKGLNPLLVAMLALPALLDELDGVLQKVDKAASDSQKAQSHPLSSIQDLHSMIDQLGTSAHELDHPKLSGGPLGILQNAAKGWGTLIGGQWGAEIQDWATGRDHARAERNRQMQQQLRPVEGLASADVRNYAEYARNLAGSRAGRAALSFFSQQMEATMAQNLQDRGLSPDQIKRFEAWLHSALQSDYEAGMALAAAHARGPYAQLQQFAALSDPQLASQAQTYGDRSEVYGLQGNDLSGVIGTYMVMAARYRNSSDPKQLQALKTAQGTVVSAVQKNVTDSLDAAKYEATPAGSQADIGRAQSDISKARAFVAQWLSQERAVWGRLPGMMKAINDAAQYLNGQFNGFAAQVLQQTLSDMQTQNALTVSKIGGSTPEADLHRAQAHITGPKGLDDQLAAAKQAGDWRQVDALQSQINDANRQNTQAQQSIDRGQIQALGDMQAAHIALDMGNDPKAAVAIARKNLATAQGVLAYDKAHGADSTALWNDQQKVYEMEKGVNDALQSANQQTAQDAQALADATAQLASDQASAAGQTVQAATILLQNAKDDLTKLKPGNFKTYALFLTAYRQAQDRIVKQAQAVTGALAQQAQQQRDNIDSAAGLRASRTDDPVVQARIARDQAAHDLATMKPNQYPTREQYLNAHRNAQATLNQRNQGLTQARQQQQIDLINENEAYGETLTDDPVKQATLRVQADHRILSLIKRSDYRSRTQWLKRLREAQTALNRDLKALADAQKQGADQLRSVLEAWAADQESMTTDPVQQAQIALRADEQLLASIKPSQFKTYAEYLQAYFDQQAKVNNDATALNNAILDQQMSTLDFQLHTQEISNSAYIAGLEKLLKSGQLSLQQRQEIMSKIFDVEHQGDVSLNLGNLKMPTTFEVQKAIRGAIHAPIAAANAAMRTALQTAGVGRDGGSIADYIGAGSQGGVTHNANSIVINVSKDTDMSAFAKALEDAVNGNLDAARAAGLR